MQTVLIVDDEPSVVEALTAQLLSLGVWIEGAYSGEEALSLLSGCPAVIIADYLMPGMRGDDFLIAAHRELPQARLILLTGQAGAENIGKVVNQARLFRYIAKPWEVEDLRLTVQEALRSYEIEMERDERVYLTQELLKYMQALLACEKLSDLPSVTSEWQAKFFPSGAPQTPARVEAQELFTRTHALRQAHLKLLDELEKQIEARTAHLATTIQELRALTSQREAWVKIVSHDLRSPLSGLKQLSALLRQGTSSSPSLSRYAEVLEKTLTELEKYVKNLLDLSRLSQKDIVLRPEAFSWEDMVRRLHALILPQLEAKGVQWSADVAPLTSQGDPVYTAEALFNILSNAVKYTPTGGEVKMRVALGEGGVVVEISDTGIGMTPEEVKALWDPTFRRSRPGTAGEKGTGLGLPIAHAILTQQGVAIQVESQPGRGTTFRLYWRSFA
ncbi:MAG: hybrid sensor histidine kinase/response regulator [Bacteroidia bacterium]|nr:hybrid sensor histidine kinase/response regulator [Bacteroidia bacterium]MCX7652963.1 hybrid sensor histidine kinase/response regulator [Bacteroidia bacterium]MDW8417474.1 hybrid sensor histidine kinase/response regulator [Bacteroidia bacterium]